MQKIRHHLRASRRNTQKMRHHPRGKPQESHTLGAATRPRCFTAQPPQRPAPLPNCGRSVEPARCALAETAEPLARGFARLLSGGQTQTSSFVEVKNRLEERDHPFPWTPQPAKSQITGYDRSPGKTGYRRAARD
jgi:hypothetical protein